MQIVFYAMIQFSQQNPLVLFQVALFRNINATAKVSGKFATPVKRSAIVQKPAIRAIMTAQAVRHGKRLARIEGSHIGRYARS